MELMDEQKVMKAYKNEITKLAKEYAHQDMSITPTTEHFVMSLADHLASIFLFNKLLVGKVHNMAIELEALRRAVQNGKGDEEELAAVTPIR